LRRAVPALVSRGVVQISAFVDTLIASLLPTGAVTGLANAQLLYTLPISLFGMSVAAAELPAMASDAGSDAAALRARLDRALRQVALFVIPSAVAFIALGDVIAAALLQTGRFGRDDAVYVWGILAGSSLGLLASTLGRVYSSAYYALRDTRTPLNFALVRIVLATGLGYLLATQAPFWLGLDPLWGAAGLTVSASAAGWVEYLLLRRSLNRRIGPTGLALDYQLTIWFGALAAAAAGWGTRLAVPPLHPIAQAVVVLVPYGVVFVAVLYAAGVSEAWALLRRLRR
jgi:putative peptidoglycan lipid II flippase